MRMTQFPKCCGAVTISGLPRVAERYVPGTGLNGDWGYYEPGETKEEFEIGLKKRLKKARYIDNRGMVFAIWSNENCEWVRDVLESTGFKVVDKTSNPRTERLMHTYIFHLKSFK